MAADRPGARGANDAGVVYRQGIEVPVGGIKLSLGRLDRSGVEDRGAAGADPGDVTGEVTRTCSLPFSVSVDFGPGRQPDGAGGRRERAGIGDLLGDQVDAAEPGTDVPEVDDRGRRLARKMKVAAREKLSIRNVQRRGAKRGRADFAPWPTTIPFGLMRKTCPLALSWPSSVEGSEPMTRLRIAEAAEGWRKVVIWPVPIEKLSQSMIARLIPG